MIIKLYKSNITIGIILPPIIAIILCLPILIFEQTTIDYNFTWQKKVFETINNTHILDFVLTLFILILNSTTIVKSFNHTSLFSKTTYLPAIIYLIFLSYFQNIHFSPILIVHFLFILLINQILSLNKSESALHISFKSGLILGLISCFGLYYSVAIFIILIPMILIRTINIRGLIIVLLGLLIPLAYLFSAQYIFMDLPLDFGTIPTINHTQYQLLDYVKILTLTLLIILGFKMVIVFNKHNSLLAKKQILTLAISSIATILLTIIFYLAYNLIDTTFIIPLIYIVSIGSISSKNDTFISFLLSITLIINIVSLFFK